jgi:transposase
MKPSSREAAMETQRYVKTGQESFFGDYLYDRVVPENHFLRKLRELIDWDRFTRKLIKLYKGEGVVGRPPFDPALLLRVELIAYLYNLSEREVETYINDCLSAKYFVGLAIDECAPDHSTLTKFRERLIARGKLKIFEEMLQEIVCIAIEQDIQFGSIQIVDSVHSVANVNTDKDRRRHDKGKVPHDPDAKWGVKHQHKVKNENGNDVTQTQYFLLCMPSAKIERKFGEGKQDHGLGRCSYLGQIGFTIQNFFTAIVLNLKRMVKLLTEVGFKTASQGNMLMVAQGR